MDALFKGRTYHPLPFALRLSSLGSVMLRSHETYTLFKQGEFTREALVGDR